MSVTQGQISQLLDRAHPRVMGILNLTPDSFSDGGMHTSRDAALRHVEAMLDAGADLIDIGGESTRPGAPEVASQEEYRRVIPVLEAIVTRFPELPVSVDTSKPEVMRAAIEAGVWMVNDVMALRAEGALDAVCASGVALCLMHMQGSPRTMQHSPHYGNIIEDIITFLQDRIAACVAAGITRSRIVIDPGFGFGKSLAHNYTLLRELRSFTRLNLPILVGLSRKSMIGQVLDAPVDARVTGSAILAALALERGASIVRAHDVRATVEAVRLVRAMNEFGME
ncbi:MAG: dihydropteroate synthase [Thiotrichales bacterium]